MGHANRSKRGDNPARNPGPDEVRAKREARGWTIAEAAKVAYLTGQFWEDVEAGKKRMHPATWQYWQLMTDGELVQMLSEVRQYIEATSSSQQAIHEDQARRVLEWIRRIESILG